MKVVLIVASCVGLLAIGILIAWSVGLLQNEDKRTTTEEPTVLLPQGSSVSGEIQPGSQDRAAIETAFFAQVEDSDSFTIPEIAALDEWAISIYQDENTGSMALMRRSTNGEWIVIATDGGVFGVETLKSHGVPEDVARKLVQALY